MTSIDPAVKEVRLNPVSGEKLTVQYDRLVMALDPEASFAAVPGLLEHTLPIMTVGDALFLRQQVLERLEHAEIVSDRRKRQALLTLAVVGGGLRGAATVAEMRVLIRSALVSFPAIAPNEPRTLLFEEKDTLLPPFGPAMGLAARRRLEKLGVEVFTGTKVTAVTPEEVVLQTGQRIACGTVVAALEAQAQVVSALPWARADGRLPVDEYLRVQGRQDILAVGDCAATGQAAPFLARREIKMGRRAAYNALALLQGYKLLRWRERTPLLLLAPLGRYATVGRLLGIQFSGIPAWVLSRSLCLLTLPGLERNLRVLVDWLMDIPFRNDIVVLAPQRTHKLGRAHYERGDEVIRQGERGDCAYLILDGEVDVLRQKDGRWQQIGRLKSGDCFGEVALLADAPRMATVRCLTPVELVVLPRDQFMTLAEGYRDLGTALKTRMTERIFQAESLVAAKQTTELT